VATELTKELIEQAFDLMGSIAAQRGLVIEIAVYGGSALVLASDVRHSSGDVDAVFLTERSIVQAIAETVAQRMGFAPNWINEAVRQMAPPRGNPQPNLSPFGEYPRARILPIGLRVHIPVPTYMLAMKILANRLDVDVEKIESDERDAVALMKITGISTRDGLVALLRECYPYVPGIVEPTIHPRVRVKIEALLDAYERSADSSEPTWNAGRGPATRPD